MEIRYKIGRKREISLSECSLEELLEISDDVFKHKTKTAYYPTSQARKSIAWWLDELAKAAREKGGSHAIITKIIKRGTFRFVGKHNKGILSWGCPFCKKPHSINVDSEGIRSAGIWTWDGNILSPTVRPCVTNACGDGRHVYISQGRFEPLWRTAPVFPIDIPLEEVVKIVRPMDPDRKGKILRAFTK